LYNHRYQTTCKEAGNQPEDLKEKLLLPSGNPDDQSPIFKPTPKGSCYSHTATHLAPVVEQVDSLRLGAGIEYVPRLASISIQLDLRFFGAGAGFISTTAASRSFFGGNFSWY